MLLPHALQASSSSWQALSSSFVAHCASARTSSLIDVSLASRAFRRARASSGGLLFWGGRPALLRRRRLRAAPLLGRRLRECAGRASAPRRRPRRASGASCFSGRARRSSRASRRSPAARCRCGQRREGRPRRARGALLAREDVAAGALGLARVDLGVAGRAGFLRAAATHGCGHGAFAGASPAVVSSARTRLASGGPALAALMLGARGSESRARGAQLRGHRSFEHTECCASLCDCAARFGDFGGQMDARPREPAL